MIKDPDFPKERIANILSVVNSSNERIAELLIKKNGGQSYLNLNHTCF